MVFKSHHSSFLFAITILLTGCYSTEDSHEIQKRGYVPVYGTYESSEIAWQAAQQINNPGKIYVYDRFLLINEKNKGIHVYDNADPTAPEPLGFIRLLGNSDMAIKDNKLYADHMGDIVHISISDFATLKEAGRLSLNDWNLGVPPPRGQYFECVDSDKGLVVSWKTGELKNNDCYALH